MTCYTAPMQWQDDGIVLCTRKHGEHGLIAHLLTREHGRAAGMLRSARKAASICQPGNQVSARWNARLEEHLGYFDLELTCASAAQFFGERIKLSALNAVCMLMQEVLPEREPHPELFDLVQGFITALDGSESWMQDYVQLEVELLTRLGYGLDLSACAATGEAGALCYVSPKSGRAVSEVSGAPYKERLLPLPSFLRPESDPTARKLAANTCEIVDGAVLTGYFLEKHMFDCGKAPAARQRFLDQLSAIME